MKSTKRKILLFTDWYYPGYKAGGPIQSCRNLVSRLSGYLQFYVVTSDRDLAALEPYEGIKINEWQEGPQGEMIYYGDRQNMTVGTIRGFFNQVQPDAVYFNSMFSVKYTILPLLILKTLPFKGKVVLAPRGMLHAGALGLKSAKKKIFLGAFRLLRLQRKLNFHATDKQEVNDIKSCFPGVQVQFAENIPHTASINGMQTPYKERGSLKLVFISRVHPTKNLLFILKILAENKFEGNISFDIYGNPDGTEYWPQCEKLISRLPGNITVNYHGELPNSCVVATLLKHHAFVLPTLGENFGHAIFEALSCGLPVLISDRTPWKNLQELQAGWDVSLDNHRGFSAAIQELLDMNEEAYRLWSQQAKKMSENFISRANYTEKYIALFS